LLTQSLTSHAASQQDYPWLTIIVDWVHLLSTSIWVGGLIALAAVLAVALPAATTQPGDRTRLLALLIPTFSRLALLAMAALILTGTFSAATELTDPGQLFSTSYGWSLSIKIILLVLLLGLGAYNLLAVSPKMRDYAEKKIITRKDAATKGVYRLTLNFRRTVLLEIALAVLALLAAAFLTSNPPPRNLNQPANGQVRAQFIQQAVQLQPYMVPIIVSFRE
jgi:putative copper export protein